MIQVQRPGTRNVSYPYLCSSDGEARFSFKMNMYFISLCASIFNAAPVILVVTCLVTQRQLCTLEENKDFVHYNLLRGDTVAHVLTFFHYTKRGM